MFFFVLHVYRCGILYCDSVRQDMKHLPSPRSRESLTLQNMDTRARLTIALTRLLTRLLELIYYVV